MTFLEFILILIMWLGFIIGIALWVKIGPEGRFMVWENIFRGGGAIGIFRKPSGQAVFRHLKAKGKSLIHGKSGFAFLPSIITVPTKAQEKMNTLIETQTILCNKPLVTGSTAAALAATPSLNEAIATAKTKEYKTVETFLTNLQKTFEDNKQLKEFYLIYEWKINQLKEYVNISYTEDDINEAYQEGYIKGLSSYENYNKMLLAACVILLLSLIAAVFWLTK